MNSSFTFAESNTDFNALSKKGIKSVLIKADENVYDTVKRAMAYKMKVMLWLNADARKRKKILVQHAGRTFCETGEIKFVSLQKLERIIKELGSAVHHICGVLIPLPEVKGFLWNKDIEKLCGFSGETQLYELFDEEVDRSSIRYEYYIGFNKYVVSKYMNPQKTFLDRLGIRTIFDISVLSAEEDTLGKMLSPVMLKSENLTLATTRENGLVEKEIGFSDDDYVITKSCMKKVEYTSGDVLLIRPTRGILERYIQNPRRKRFSRVETPALSAALEGICYSSMLEKSGHLFDVVDELFFSEERDFTKYKTMLICESCLFKEAEMTKIRELEEKGISINPRDLICDLMAKGEE